MDLNSDIGESFGAYRLGDDAALLPFVTSVNIACGFHAGDPSVMQATVRLSAAAGVRIGAHPGYPDLQGFGRRSMDLSPEEVEALVLYQVGALAGFCRAHGAPLVHVKPHGALYNQAAADRELAAAIARAVAAIDPSLVLFGLSGSCLISEAEKAGLRTCSEVFADRNYEADGSLTPRGRPDAMITDPAAAADRVVGMIETGCVPARGGESVRLSAGTVCIHGDGPHALRFARLVNERLRERGIAIAAP
jgi:UPF0271 protein